MFHLAQTVSSQSNGTALWLGGQVLALYVASEYPVRPTKPIPAGAEGKGEPAKRRRACELGSGVGFTALALASIGWDVQATDVPFIANGVLTENIASNTKYAGPEWGQVRVRAVDWCQPMDPSTWDVNPPYDLIITADTLYAPELVAPLFQTLKSLAEASILPGKKTSCPILVCLERRDPQLIDAALKEGVDIWGFVIKRMPQTKIVKLVEREGMSRDDIDGLEIWKFALRREVK